MWHMSWSLASVSPHTDDPICKRSGTDACSALAHWVLRHTGWRHLWSKPIGLFRASHTLTHLIKRHLKLPCRSGFKSVLQKLISGYSEYKRAIRFESGWVEKLDFGRQSERGTNVTLDLNEFIGFANCEFGSLWFAEDWIRAVLIWPKISKVKATQTECERLRCTVGDPGSHQWLPDSRCEPGRVVASSDGAESPTLASRAVLMGM